ncbi:anhydro-N-acetylmuramic acid kinase [Motilimonas eburnea]|uniref:anhydro-N-acetylmuramic acid kinase n=1 Tax=Motilimonas eburnea TaxID=1737488 RepID=UPI001E54C045|nr:anhydro-N-acetylmuramic acid kinase [Motilimonas eburnea]MCE2570793.1 anhydro-N-acetylmuramic acid kinase [Motilimonas eburnea]
MANAHNKHQYYIGLMSGTSLDGVDVSIVNFASWPIEPIYSQTFELPKGMKESILSICQGQSLTLLQLGTLDHQIGLFHSQCVDNTLYQAGISAKEVIAIGSHGQTVYHHPSGDFPFTLQIGDANIIAAQTNITTVGDLRRMDMAYKGQGAPLVPAFHQAIFTPEQGTNIVLNIGGIANITVLRQEQATVGYDTGPGNMLMNAWIEEELNHPYDKNGHWAAQGNLIPELLETLLQDPYFALPAPKSTGREHFNLAWLKQYLQPEYRSVDVQHTLMYLTAQTIADQINLFSGVKRVIICGGGIHNHTLFETLKKLLPGRQVISSIEYGMDPNYVEAIAFAWLAKQRVDKQAGNLPHVTGAQQAAILGAIYEPTT